ncbi:dihydrodipicolinate synthase family protein [Streptomyces polygonati]|uniref:Dihydrodipicolinate synthase family protein n=1 Tax=Streptomyces polygonati TaxID=1617087 RepID=A0ABV8HMM7_9ACTN
MYAGLTAALVTPLTAHGGVSGADVSRLVGIVRPHVDALLATLSTGEGWALTRRQWTAMVSHTVRQAGRTPVWAGLLWPHTAQVAELAREAAGLGARAVAVATPFGRQVSQEQMYRHYRVVSAASRLPVIVYVESAVSGNTLELGTLLRICALPGVAAVKDSGGSPGFTRALIAARPGLPVLQGLEERVHDRPGTDGWVMALANVEPALCAEVFAGRADAARSAAGAALLREACERHGLARDDWYRTVKAELHRRGVISTDVTAARDTAEAAAAADRIAVPAASSGPARTEERSPV